MPIRYTTSRPRPQRGRPVHFTISVTICVTFRLPLLRRHRRHTHPKIVYIVAEVCKAMAPEDTTGAAQAPELQAEVSTATARGQRSSHDHSTSTPTIQTTTAIRAADQSNAGRTAPQRTEMDDVTTSHSRAPQNHVPETAPLSTRPRPSTDRPPPHTDMLPSSSPPSSSAQPGNTVHSAAASPTPQLGRSTVSVHLVLHGSDLGILGVEERFSKQLKYVQNCHVPPLSSVSTDMRKGFMQLLNFQVKLSKSARLHIIMETDQSVADSSKIATVDLYHIFSPTISIDSVPGRKTLMRVGEGLAVFKLLANTVQVQRPLLPSTTSPSVDTPSANQRQTQTSAPLQAPPSASRESRTNPSGSRPPKTAPKTKGDDDTDSILDVPDDDGATHATPTGGNICEQQYESTGQEWEDDPEDDEPE